MCQDQCTGANEYVSFGFKCMIQQRKRCNDHSVFVFLFQSISNEAINVQQQFDYYSYLFCVFAWVFNEMKFKWINFERSH